jgi:hypothetical protein
MRTAWFPVPVPVSRPSCQTTRTGHHGTLAGPWDAGATVTAADPLAKTLIVRLDASHDYQPRRQVLANCAMVGQRWPVERTCLGPTQYGKLR